MKDEVWDVRSNHKRQMQQYLDNYDIGHARGLIGESAFQNPIDAAYRGILSKVRINIYVDPENRILKIRDRGTTGMPHCPDCEWGIKDLEDGSRQLCENFNHCQWSAFHTLAQEAKVGESLGQRGMGKSLAALAGENGIIIRTKVADQGGENVSMASHFRPREDSGIGAWGWVLKPDEAWGDSEDPGTEIQVVGLKDELIADFNNPQKIVDDYILPYWFFSIAQGVELTLLVKGHSTIKIGPASVEKMFPPVGPRKKKSWGSLPIKSKRKIVGKIKNLNVFLAEEPLPEELRGIALVKGGKQVITRLNSFGRNIDRDLQDCLFGWVDTGHLLADCEKPDHLGYRLREPLVKRTNETIIEVTRSFLEPFNREKQRDEPVSKKDIEKANQIRDAVNRAFDEVPDFNPWLEGEESGDKTGDEPDEQCPKCGQKPCVCIKPPSKERRTPWVSSIRFEPSTETGYHNVGDTVTARVVVSNPVDKDFPRLSVKWRAANTSREIVDEGELVSDEFGDLPRPSLEGLGEIEHEFKFDISLGEGGFRRGKNLFGVLLSQTVSEGGSSELVPLHESKRAFYVEYKPDSRRTSGGSSKINLLTPTKAPGRGLDVYLDDIEQEVLIFTADGPNIAPYWLQAGKHKDAVSNVLYALADEILLMFLEREAHDSEDSDISQSDSFRELIMKKIQWVAAAQSSAEV